jgi:hypothetical protein
MRIFSRVLAAAVLGAVLAVPGAITQAASTKANLPVIRVVMNGRSITVAGTLQSGGVLVQANTTGEQSGELILLRLNPGVTMEQVAAFMSTPAAQDANAVSRVGTIVVDAGTPRGMYNVMTWLQPGQYIALDSGSQNKPPSAWPKSAFTVTQAARPASLPAAQATLHLIDFGFRGPSTFRVGESVRVYNNGFVVHMADAFGVRSLRDANTVVALLRAGKDKQAQRMATDTFISFNGPISHNSFQQINVQGAPGYYVLACFMDTQDGREHTMLGMERVIRVVR